MKCVRACLAVLSLILVSSTTTSGAAFAPGLYGAAEGRNEIIRINSDGTWETVFGVFFAPRGMSFRDSDSMYVGGPGEGWPKPWGDLRSYRPDGTVETYFPPIPVTNGFSNGSGPMGMAIDSDGTAYIATTNTPGATRLRSDGTAEDWTGYQPDLWWGRAAVIAPNGDLYMTQGLRQDVNSTSTVARIDKVTGHVEMVLTNIPFINGISIDRDGNMYLSEYDRGLVVKVSAGTTTLTPFAEIDYPTYSCFGPDGRLYVHSIAQTTNPSTDSRIWAIDLSTGQLELYADHIPYMYQIEFSPASFVVPEPSTIAMISCAGLVSLATFTIRRLRRDPKMQSGCTF